MKISERARKLNEAINHIDQFDSHDQAAAVSEDRALFDLAESLLSRPPFQPGPQQERRLQTRLAQLALQANPQQAARQRQRYHFSAAVRVVGTVALLAVFSLIVVFLFQNIPPQPAADTPQPLVLANATPSAVATIAKEIIPKNLAIIPDACALNAADTFLDENMFSGMLPKTFVGGGSVESGDFRFDLWLACDQRFSTDLGSGADDFSELNGLGILAGWRYDGPKEEGSLLDYAGFEPFVKESSTTAPIGSSLASFVESGIHLSNDIIPDFTKQDTHLRYIYFTQLPSGERTGAALSFTLKREEDGYRPVDIAISVLEADELAGIENQVGAPLPFATRSPIDGFPQMTDIRQKLQDWESSLLDQPGWLYIKTAVSDTGTNMLYNGVSEYIDEGWYLLDENRQAVQMINQTTALDGRVLQQSIYQDGTSKNLTTSTSYNYTPTPMNLVDYIISKLTSQARTGEDWQPTETSWQGQTAWVFTDQDSFPSPTTLDDTDNVIAVEGHDYIDPLTGQRLGDETYIFTADGEEKLVRRNITLAMEHVDKPPAAVLALFDQELAPYSPPQAIGMLPPASFDAAQAKLSLTSQPGDYFDRPTFWVGDIFGDDYLLGRLNFGMVPGGRCQRSSDGSQIAILYETQSPQGDYNAEVQWFPLSDLENLKQPAPQLNALGRFIAWSPTDALFAISGCLQDGSQCGLYLVDTATNDVRFLSSAALSAWPIIWNPEGSQLALVDTRDDRYRFFVIDAVSGETIYEGFFDANKWQVPANSPAASWGIRIPHNSGEESGCFK